MYSAGSKVGSSKGVFWLSLEGFRLLLLVGNVGGVEDMAFVSGRVCVVRGYWVLGGFQTHQVGYCSYYSRLNVVEIE